MKARRIKLVMLALSIVMALALVCVPAYAAEEGGESAAAEALTGDDGQTVHYRVDDDGKVTILDEVSEDSMVLAAYWNGSRFLGAKELKVGDVSAQTISNWTRIKLFWLDRQAKPVSPAPVVKTGVAQAKTITSGITRWADLTTRHADNYVADGFATDDTGADVTAYYLNGAEATAEDVKLAAARRGTVVELYTDDDERIATVKAYMYTVDLVENGDPGTKTLADGTLQVRVPGVVNSYIDADKVTGWEDLKEGDVVLVYKTALSAGDFRYTIEKAEKVTGTVRSFTTGGKLNIDGTYYVGSEQPSAGSFGDVAFVAYSATHTGDAQDIFSRWVFCGYTLDDEYDFYLDKNGSIVAAIQRTEAVDDSKVCMVLEAEVSDAALGVSGSLRANLLFADGSTEIVNISKVDKKTVTDKVTNVDTQISTTDAYKSLVGTRGAEAMTGFFAWKSTSSGYELTTLNAANDARNWEDPASVGDGTAVIATVRQLPDFAGAVDSSGRLADWDITADSTTTFLVGERSSYDDAVTYTVYRGFKSVPELDATRMTAICANTTSDSTQVNTVAKYVYLETTVEGEAPPDEPEGESKVGMVLEAEVTDAGLGVPGALRAILLFEDGSTEIATVSKVDGLTVKDTVTNADTQITTTDAFKSLVGNKGKDTMAKFFRCAPTASGYALTTLSAANDPESWEDPASLGYGGEKIATVRQDAAFAKAVGGTDNLAGWDITADADTTFLVGKRDVNTDAISFFVYRGFQNIPEVDITFITAICANTTSDSTQVNTVARYVYLETTVEGEAPPDEPEGESMVGMVLEAEVTDANLGTPGALRANLLFEDGKTEIVTVYKVDGRTVKDTVTNADTQISTTDAFKSLVGTKGKDAMSKFFRCAPTASGYALTTLSAASDPESWENPVSLGDGTAKIASIARDPEFVRVLGTLGNNSKSLESAWTTAGNGSYIIADADTTFLVGKRDVNTDAISFFVYRGFQSIPQMDATMITALCAGGSGTAQYVYLETGSFKGDVPDGYIFLYDNEVSIDPELAGDDVYLTKIVDTDGTWTEMRVTADLAQGIAADPTILNKTRSYMGHFFAIGELDDSGVVSQLTNGAVPPAERAVPLGDLVALGNDVVAVSSGGIVEYYVYDSDTRFVYVDMGWIDGGQSDNALFVREEGKDDLRFSDAGTFQPNGFFNANDVDPDMPEAPYKSVEAAVICPYNSTIADYVYILRTLW